MVQFTKQARNSQELIAIYRSRGLEVADQERADRYLSFIGYYRFSAYTIPFQETNPAKIAVAHQFKANTSFDNILNLYVFDRKLRVLVTDAIERIEVAIRAQICNITCELTQDAFWYINKEIFNKKYDHARLISSIEKQLQDEKRRLQRDEIAIDKRPISTDEKNILKENARKENFLRHYLSKYDNPKLPPSWMMIEMLTWGDLSFLYTGLKSIQTKKKIAQNLGLQAEILESWLKCLHDVRNACAHHGRLWNKEHGRNIKIPTSPSIQWLKSPVNLSHDIARYEKRTYVVNGNVKMTTVGN